MRVSEEHPAPAPAAGAATLPHAIDWAAVWADWEARVLDAAPAELRPDALLRSKSPVAELAIAILEEGQRRLSDAAASLDEADEPAPPARRRRPPKRGARRGARSRRR